MVQMLMVNDLGSATNQWRDLYLSNNIIADGDITLDSAGDIILDADGADIIFKDAGTEIGRLDLAGGLALKSSVSDADFFIQGNDGGSIINALQIDMSNGGSATFLDDIDLVCLVFVL